MAYVFMEIKKEKIEKYIFYTICKKCEKKIKGTSELTLKHNFKVHNTFCKDKK